MHTPLTARSLLALALFSSSVLAIPRYTIQELPIPDGYDRVWPRDINEAGEVVGHAFQIRDYATDGGGYLYSGSTASLVTFNEFNSIDLWGINNSSAVAGQASVPQSNKNHLAYKSSEESIIDSFGIAGPFVHDLNDAGIVVGYYNPHRNGYLVDRGFSYHNRQITDLGHLGGDYSIATAINTAGAIVGTSKIALDSQQWAGFLYQHGQLTSLGIFPGHDHTEPRDINDYGVIVGETGPADWYPSWERKSEAFMLKDGRYISIARSGGYAAALELNNRGTVVGVGYGANRSFDFIYEDGLLWNPSDLIDDASDWTQVRPFTINERGQIAGEGLLNGFHRPFLMTPIPDSDVATQDVSLAGPIVNTGDLDSLRNLIIQGRGTTSGGVATGQWNGQTGITSSTAAQAFIDNNKETLSIGYARNSDLPTPYTTFLGQPATDSDLLLRLTTNGDANLDGLVNNNDITILAAHYRPGESGKYWHHADFNYDGFVDNNDITILAGFFAPDADSLATAPLASQKPIPEPSTSVGLLALSLAMLRRSSKASTHSSANNPLPHAY